jgi:succinate-acetate transporter protein
MWYIAFTLFGSFWLSYAAILIPGSGILASYPTVRELHTALGFFFTAWFGASILVTCVSLFSFSSPWPLRSPRDA